MAKKILVIDDDHHIVEYVVSLLKDNGYDTCTASTGASGIEMELEVVVGHDGMEEDESKVGGAPMGWR